MTQDFQEKNFGSILKEARGAKNISLEEVSKGTKIHVNILKAIEAEDIQALGAVYVKSFIRIYAEYLGLDKEDLARRFEALKTGSQVPRPKETRVKTPAGSQLRSQEIFSGSRSSVVDFLSKIPWARLIVVVVLVFVLWNVGKFIHKKVVKSGLPKQTDIAADSASIKEEGAVEEPEAKKKIKAVVSKAKKTSAKVVLKEQAKLVSKAAPSSKPESLVKSPAVIRPAEKLDLVIRAKEKTWLQVKVDGKTVFQGVLAKGVSDSWQAKEKMELWLGNAGVVQLELNGKLLEKIGRPGQTLKRVLVTRAGLSIEK